MNSRAVASSPAGLSGGGAAEPESSEAVLTREQGEELATRWSVLFQTAFDSAPIGIALTAPDGSWLAVNDALCELTGYSKDELLARSFTEITHPDDRAMSSENWLRHNAGGAGSASRIEKRYVRSDGQIVWVDVKMTRMNDAGGTIFNVAHIENITERRDAQRSLEEAEERFRHAFDDALIGMALVGLDGGLTRTNASLCEMLGYTEEELLELTFYDLTHPDDLEASNDWVRGLYAGEYRSFAQEKRYVRKDGTPVWVKLSISLVRDAAENPFYFVSQIENITERRDAQRSLEEAEERFRRAFDDAPIGMALVGLDGSWLRTNASLCEMLGYDEPDLLEMRFQDLTHPDDLETSTEWVRGLLAGECRSFSHEKRYVRRDGSVVWGTLSVSLVRDASDVPLYFVSQIEDVHDRKLAETKTAQLLELEREHVERLRALDVLKDEFVASVSHELRTPLTSIQGYLEFVLDGDAGELNEEQRRHLATVSRNSERLLRLVGDLLFVAQTDAGKLELTFDDVDLGTLVHESIESARPPAAARQIQLEVSVDELPPLRGDRARLAQLLDNLVSNALKFTPEGGSVTVSLTRGDGCAVLEVRDTGIGIPAAEQDQLFKRFFRARGATERAIQGTGLGLSIARTIAESHGGQIGFESVEGVGTSFRVQLPLDARL